MKQEPIIVVKNLKKVFRIPHEKLSTIKQHFVSIFDSKSFEEFNALDNVSFEVKRGEFFGIIGANGSGKSTLLKILAQIYQPTSGKVEVRGTLSPFIELGVGFNPELTARENIFLNAAILGLSKKQTEEKFNEIVEFSELRNFLDQKLKNFSSGMQVRLAFSISIQAHADILLIDEVLAVGDAAFQQKCLTLFRDLKRDKRTIIFVSHSLEIIEEFCDRVLFIKNGKTMFIGSPAETVYSYLSATTEEQISKDKKFKGNKTFSKVRITQIEMLTGNNSHSKLFRTHDDLTVRVYFESKERIEKPVFGLAIHREDGVHVTGPNTKTSKYEIPFINGKGYIEYKVSDIPLLSGKYLITVGIFNNDLNFVYDFVDRKENFRVIPNYINQNGLIKFQENWNLVN